MEQQEDTDSMKALVPHSFLPIIWRTRKVSLSCPLIDGGEDREKAFLGITFTGVSTKYMMLWSYLLKFSRK